MNRSSEEVAQASITSVDAAFWAQVALLLVTFCAFYSYFFWDQIVISMDPDWSHAYLVPFISAYYIYCNKEKILTRGFHPWNLLGLVAMAGGFVGYLFFTYTSTWNHFGQGMAMDLTLMGVVLFMVGWPMWRTLFFPMAYLLMGVRMPERLLQLVTPTLQVYASKGSYYLLTILGYNVDVAGTVLTVHDHGKNFPVNVAEACSGMRMIVAFVALGIAVAFITCDKWWQRIVLIIAGVPIAIIINVFRVASLGVLATWNSDLAQGESHIYIGMLWLVPALALYMGLAWVLQRVVEYDSEQEEKAKNVKRGVKRSSVNHSRISGHMSWPATIVSAVLLGGGYGAFLSVQSLMNYELKKLPVALRHSLRELPAEAGRWKEVGADLAIPKEELDALGTTQYVSRNYAIDGDPGNGMMRLDVTYYTGGIDAVPHIPDRCFVGGGLIKAPVSTSEPLTINQTLWWPDPDYVAPTKNGESGSSSDQPHYMMAQVSGPSRAVVRMPLLPDKTLELNSAEYWPPQDKEHTIAAGYFFIANGTVTDSADRVRLFAYDLKEKYAYYCKVQLTLTNANRAVDRKELAKDASEFLNVMLPDIMRCLPDWHDVNNGTWPPPAAGKDKDSGSKGH